MKRFFAVLAVSLLAATAAQAAEFEAVDVDADGFITFEEAADAMPELTEDAFTAADADGDGSLTADEFATVNN